MKGECEKKPRFFLFFAGNLHAWKPNKEQKNRSNIMGIQCFALINRWHQLHILSFILSSLTSSKFVPTYFFASTTTRVRHPGLDRHTNYYDHITPYRWQYPCCYQYSLPTTALPETYMPLHISLPTTKTYPPRLWLFVATAATNDERQ